MAQISTNIILDGITLALRAAFPDSHIDIDEVKQGLNPPAFIVMLVSGSYDAYPSQMQRRLMRFDIAYFPKAKSVECYEVADTLADVLEVIELPGGDKLTGTDMSAEVTDDVLHMFVSYNHFTITDKDYDYMESLAVEREGI